MEKPLVFLRKSRLYHQEPERYTEQLARYALSAWVKNVDRAMARLRKGEQVFTPYAVYTAMTVDQLQSRDITSKDDIIYE